VATAPAPEIKLAMPYVTPSVLDETP